MEFGFDFKFKNKGVNKDEERRIKILPIRRKNDER